MVNAPSQPSVAARRLPSAACALAGFALAACFLWPSLTGAKAFLPADLWWKSSDPWAPLATRDIRSFPSNQLLGDQADLYAPQLWVGRESLRNGGMMLWNPYAGCGEPLLGSGISGPLAPTNLPILWMRWPDGFAWSALLRFGSMWLGAFLLGRVLGLGLGWALALAVGFCFAPGFLLHFQQPRGSIHIWLPWLLLCVERIARASDRGIRGTIRAALPAALPVLAMLLGGHQSSAFNDLFGAGLYALIRLPMRPLRSALASRAVAALAFALGFALSAPATVPAVDALRDSSTLLSRAYGEGAGAWVIGRDALALFWDPFALGSPLPGASRPWSGSANFEEDQQYIGILPWVFLVGCLPIALRRRAIERGALAALGAVVLVSASLVFGWQPLHGWLTAIPPFSFNSNPRFAILSQIGVLLAAGLASRAWLQPPGRPRGRVAALLLAGAASGAIALSAHAGIWDPRPWVALVSAAALFGAGRFAATERQRAIAAAIVPLLLLAELAPLYRGYHPQVPRAWANPDVARAALPPEMRDDPNLRAAMLSTTPNLFSMLGAVDPRSSSYPMSARYEAYASEVMGIADPAAVAPEELADRKVFVALERTCADWLMSSLPDGTDLAPRLRPVGRYGHLRFDRLLDAPPWAAWHPVDEIHFVDGLESAVLAVGAGLRDADEPIVVEDAAQVAEPRTKAGSGLAAVARHVTTEQIEVEVPSAARRSAGYVILRSSYDRGWRAASQSGAPLRVGPAQIRFLAVEAPAGTERIVLRYRPPHMEAALAFSGCALLALAAAAIWASRPGSADAPFPRS